MLKKVFSTILVSVLFLINLSAQHMSFMGIQMGTNVDSFKQKMLQKNGFKEHPLPDKGILGIDGTFSGQDAAFSILYTSKSRLVEQVVVSFSTLNYYTTSYNANTREAMQNGYYDKFREEITKKYGTPSFEEYNSSGDYIKWCQWNLNEGTIILYIAEYSDNPHYRRMDVVYEDKLAVKQGEKEKASDW